jgi:biotin carboxyl carrier protein
VKRFELLLNGKAYLVEVTKITGESALVTVNGTPYEVGINDLSKMDLAQMMKESAPSQPAPVAPAQQTCLVESAGGLITVKAPLPGLIIDIKVAPGDKVKPGDVLVVIETMKMENNVVSPRVGTIKEISIKKGDTVAEGIPLVVIAE